jgi:3-methyladenine DNA glycosylase/8-oxoguanine DNA glycosylase
MAEARFTLTPPPPFELRLALFGHGWIDLPPHAWDPARGAFTTVLGLAQPLDARVVQRGGRLHATLRAARPLGTGDVGRARAALRAMLRLDEDFTPLWRACARVPRLRWAARRGAGRMLRSSGVFEDLLKILLTTNCAWSATRRMTVNLVEALGAAAPSGRKAFPGAERVAAAGEAFFRDVVRAGYRSRACVELGEAFASGRLTDAAFTDPGLSTDEVRRRLLALHGFGEYAAGQALRLLGRYDDLALDSWCRARLRTQGTTERQAVREYRRFGAHAGIVLWLDITRDWHEHDGAERCRSNF